jgi:putative nucleotidyltransferase with HDIG domain
MKIKCPNCPQVYNISKEKFPEGKKKIAFPCPACKATIRIDLNKTDKEVDALNKSNAAQTDTPKKGVTDSQALKKKIMRSVTDLPPLPQVLIKANEIMANPSSTFKDLGGIIETDQAIAGRVLKLANSAYYGLRGMVSSIHQASVVLGFEALGELISVVGAAGLLDNILSGYGLEAGSLWQHSLAVAFGSKIIARKKYPTHENDAFSAGLLHDCGKMILDEYVKEREEQFDSFLKGEGKTYLAAEKQILGFDHAEIAFDLCKKWNIPESQTIAIRYHHCPSESNHNELAYIIHIADVLAMKGGIGTGFDSMFYEIERKALEFTGIPESELEEVMQEMVESVDKVSEQIHQ